jgi:cyclase
MFRPRIIPVLLLKNKTLVKSEKFKKFRYIGDAINAVRIFNELKADELVFLDIEATSEKRTVSLDFVKAVGEEANMPFSVGGGIRTVEHIKQIIAAGAEKVIIGTYAVENPDFIKQASETFGSSTIVVCVDVKKTLLGKQKVWITNAQKRTNYTPVDFANLMEEKGAGELIIQSIDNDGVMSGYDLDLIKTIAESVKIPVIALGGAGDLSHLKQAYKEAYASALAAGSLFVFKGGNKGVLINYPEKTDLNF